MDTVKECLALQCRSAGETPVYEMVQLREVGDDDFLMRVEATGIGYIDRFRISGEYPQLGGFPFVPGNQGVGRVVKTGKHAHHLLDKRVIAFWTGGVWAEYVVGNVHQAIPIDEDVPVESAAFGARNPYTVIGLLDTIKKAGKKSVVIDAAASGVGRMINRLAGPQGIKVLNIVKREDQRSILVQEGFENIILTEGDWQSSYKKTALDLQADCLINCLGTGDEYSILIEGLVAGGLVLVIGWLRGAPAVDVDTMQRVDDGKHVVQGWSMLKWLRALPTEEWKALFKDYSERLKNELSTTVQSYFHFKNIEEALKASRANTSRGKIMLIP